MELEELSSKVGVGGRVNEWQYFPKFHLNLYYRLTQRMLNGSKCDTIDLASIEVDEEYRGGGFFKLFLSQIEAIAKRHRRVVFVESILNHDLYDFLVRRGYKSAGSDSMSLYM